MNNTPLLIAILAVAVLLLIVGALLLFRPGTKHQLHDVETEVAKWSRWVVAKRLLIVAAAVIVINVLMSWHLPYITQSFSDHAVTWINRVIDGIGVLLAIPFVQKATTPADPAKNPTDIHGNALVPALSVGPHAGVDATADSDTALSAAAQIFPSQPADPVADPAVPPTA